MSASINKYSMLFFSCILNGSDNNILVDFATLVQKLFVFFFAYFWAPPSLSFTLFCVFIVDFFYSVWNSLVIRQSCGFMSFSASHWIMIMGIVCLAFFSGWYRLMFWRWRFRAEKKKRFSRIFVVTRLIGTFLFLFYIRLLYCVT